MSNTKLGKQFESIFRKDWKRCFPNTFIYRLPDQITGYKDTSQNPCDFLAFNNNTLWMLECKETTEGTINFAKIPQLERLEEYIGLDHVEQYIIVWYSQYDKVIACPASEALKMKKDGKKSIYLKMLEDKSYNIIEIPSTKKRVFMESDYTCLINKGE